MKGLILSFFTVTTSLATVILFFDDVLRPVTDSEPLHWMLIVWIFLTGLFSLASSWIFKAEDSGKSASVRLLIFFLIITGAVFYFFVPSVPLLLVIPVIITVWSVCPAESRPYFQHVTFMEHCKDKDGSALQNEMYDMSVAVSEYSGTFSTMLKAKSITSGILVVVVTVFAFLKLEFSPLTIIFSCINPAFVIAESLIYAVYKKENELASSGFAYGFKKRKTVAATITALTFVCLLSGVCLSPGTTILKPDYLVSFLNFAVGRTKVPPALHSTVDTGSAVERFTADELKLAPPREMKTLSVDMLWKIIGAVDAVIIVAILVFFLLSPLTSSQWQDFWKERKLLFYIKSFFRLLADFFKGIFSFRPEKKTLYNTVGAEEFKQKVESFAMKAKKSKEKLAELDRLTRKFMILISWGETNGVEYSKNLAPKEYTDKLKLHFSGAAFKDAPTAETVAAKPGVTGAELSECLDAAGVIFEKALYGQDVILPDEEASFKKSILKVTGLSENLA